MRLIAWSRRIPTDLLAQFVPHNNLSWHIPLEDLREGEVVSGAIGQELYGAGGPFMFAAYAQ